ncbi:SRPBCC family protein [Leptolyngbya sp. FACHB-261]|uniref:SRPBCC family protein n=1 Tax=Leptolyngbya sp. FACHB-261 TaxID=2692806 RepID=UPI001684BDF8|nr:SRPBCC family protein [Leptolyngbya sp. FACHB-261]MBD2103821.1 SRPBCC family protein [Leptolyngbya sp. FACHB-261]
MTKLWLARLRSGLCLGGLYLAGALLWSGLSLPVSAQSRPSHRAIDTLPAQERVLLQRGRPVITGDNGRYTARVLVRATPAQVWSVITDYGNFWRFLPNIASSRVVERQGNRRVVEQVDRRRIALTTISSRVRLAITETPRRGFSFQLLEGNLKKMQGNWRLEPLRAYPGGPVTQVLITQQIQAEPNQGIPAGLFYRLFRSQLSDHLEAIRTEIATRQS